MKLYMREKIFSWNDRFTVWNEDGSEKYFVEGELFSWGKKLHVNDTQGNEAAFIRQKVMTLLPRYYVYVGGEETAEIVKEFSFFFPKYSIEGLGWEIEGSFFDHDYQITKDGQLIAEIHKEWFTFGDCYAIDIADPADEITALAVVLAIDCVLDQQSNS